MWKDRKEWHLVALLCLIGLTLFYSTYKLTESPPTWFDEGIYIQVAESLVTTGVQSIQTAPGELSGTAYVTGGYPFLLPVGLSMKFFGVTLFGARVAMAFFIVVCVLLSWFLIYRLFGATEAVLALLLIATFPVLYGNGKNVLGEVPGMVYTLLALWSVWCLEKNGWRGTRYYIVAGLLFGLAAVTKPIFFLLPISAAIVVAVRSRFLPLRWRDVLLSVCAAAVPFALWVFLQFGSWYPFTSLLGHYVNPYAEQSLIHTIFTNALRFFTESTPLYCGALMALWSMAVAIRVWQRKFIATAEWIAFVFSWSILAAYLRTAGWYRYFFEAMVLALLFAPHSLRVVAEHAGKLWPRLARPLMYAPLVLLALGAMQWYQLTYSSWVAEHYTSDQTALLEHYSMSFPGDKTVFVYNTPQIVPFLPTSKYYQYFDIEPTGALAYGKENVQLLADAVPDMVVARYDFWQSQQALFARYALDQEVGAYVVLKRAVTKTAENRF